MICFFIIGLRLKRTFSSVVISSRLLSFLTYTLPVCLDIILISSFSFVAGASVICSLIELELNLYWVGFLLGLLFILSGGSTRKVCMSDWLFYDFNPSPILYFSLILRSYSDCSRASYRWFKLRMFLLTFDLEIRNPLEWAMLLSRIGMSVTFLKFVSSIGLERRFVLFDPIMVVNCDGEMSEPCSTTWFSIWDVSIDPTFYSLLGLSLFFEGGISGNK